MPGDGFYRNDYGAAGYHATILEKYLQNYSTAFMGDDKDYPAWVAHKRRVNRTKTFIQVDLLNLSIYAYPQKKDMVVVSYRQQYRSDNFRGTSHKRQYWKKEQDGRWRIIYEGRG